MTMKKYIVLLSLISASSASTLCDAIVHSVSRIAFANYLSFSIGLFLTFFSSPSKDETTFFAKLRRFIIRTAVIQFMAVKVWEAVPTKDNEYTSTQRAISSDWDYAYKAKALCEYQADPEDPNELSFFKGEVFDVVDNKGQWWIARKADGTVGITPSNYVSLRYKTSTFTFGGVFECSKLMFFTS
ncbi:12832_t:CDS:2 [Ambispora gerdemannii]|uniref:12832_t:CDS:1 n=1 Tax=Ambispora gerdemannii TaxID=144530 RepID=A0A9N8VJG6_9GLOM|nr:12832_t:CDS:2 [Ambispora gerdemannii]